MSSPSPAGGIMIAPPAQIAAVRMVAVAQLADRLYASWWECVCTSDPGEDGWPDAGIMRTAADASIDAAQELVAALEARKEAINSGKSS